jgi:hypothetical protein
MVCPSCVILFFSLYNIKKRFSSIFSVRKRPFFAFFKKDKQNGSVFIRVSSKTNKKPPGGDACDRAGAPRGRYTCVWQKFHSFI